MCLGDEIEKILTMQSHVLSGRISFGLQLHPSRSKDFRLKLISKSTTVIDQNFLLVIGRATSDYRNITR